MTVYLATDDESFGFVSMFERFGGVKILPNNIDKACEISDAELVIFTGGEDVHPNRYDSQPTSWEDYNEKRDKWELKLMRYIYSSIFEVKKVLGVCRGLQLMNVYMRGTLVQDIQDYYGKPHQNIHRLLWREDTVFNDLTMVNSIHHQCVASVGMRIRPTILAVEPETRAIESVCWGEKYFGVQFHPEWFNGEMLKVRDDFANKIMDWVRKDVSILKDVKKSSVKTGADRYYKVDFASFSNVISTKDSSED